MIKVKAIKPIEVSPDGISTRVVGVDEVVEVSEAAAVHFEALGMAERVDASNPSHKAGNTPPTPGPSANTSEPGPVANTAAKEPTKRKGGRPPRK